MQIRELAGSIEDERAADADAAARSREEALGLRAPASVPTRRSAWRAARITPRRQPAKRPLTDDDDYDNDADGSDAAGSDGSASRSSKSYDPLGVLFSKGSWFSARDGSTCSVYQGIGPYHQTMTGSAPIQLTTRLFLREGKKLAARVGPRWRAQRKMGMLVPRRTMTAKLAKPARQLLRRVCA